MAFCLPREFATKFVNALKDGTINPEKMIAMTSEQRRAFLKDIVGEIDAKEVNALLESKLILKDQKRGMVSWAKKVSGISEPVRADMISKIEKLQNVLDVSEQNAFLKDLASKKLGTEITFEEAKTIAELSKRLAEQKTRVGSSEQARLEYGVTRVALQNYVNDLKISNAKPTIKGVISDIKNAPFETAKEGFMNFAGLTKGLKASLDASALLRQGLKSLFTNPDLWARNALKTFQDMKAQLGKKATDNQVIDAMKADIYSRPNAVDGTYAKMKLDIGLNEEAFPTALPERIPALGRLYKTSEVAYTGFLQRMRADLADRIVDMAKEQGVNVKDVKELESIGKMVNSMTGRGNIGSLEKIGKELNVAFFSPKNLKSNIDFLTAHQFQKGVTPFVRRQAAINLLKVVGGISVILSTAEALYPDSVELDPRSADFGKIRIGDTRFDVSGGMASLVTLAARLSPILVGATPKTKSSTTGRVSELNTGNFGSQSGWDVLVNFFSNKASPVGSVLINHLKGTTFEGEKPTLKGDIKDLIAPLSYTTTEEALNNPNSAPLLLILLLDSLGIGANTYSPKK